jgi:hypothetical protein
MAARPATTPAPRSGRARPARTGGQVGRGLLVAAALAPAAVVTLGIRSGLVNLVQLVGAAVGLTFIGWLASRPTAALRALVWILPVQLVLSSLAFQVYRDGPTLRMAALWKDAAVAAIAVAVAVSRRRTPRELDVLDRACLAFTALSGLYLVAPGLLLGPLGGAVTVDARFTTWRSVALPVLLVFLGRHLRVDADVVRRVSRTFMRWGAVFGALAVVELVASSIWNTLMVDVVGVNRFRLLAQELPARAFTLGLDEIRIVSATGLVRVGGVFVSALQLSFFLLVCFAFLVERVVRGDSSLPVRVGLALNAVGILLTQTRSVVLGALVVALVGARPSAGRSTAARGRFAALLVAACVFAVPLLGVTGYVERFLGRDAASDVAHEQSTAAAFEAVVEHPMGQGLGLGAQGANIGVPGAMVAENHFLDVALQLGVAGAVLFAVVLFALIRRLRQAAAAVGGDLQLGAAAARSALLGMLVPLWFLQPWTEPQVGWVLPLVAGAALGAVERRVDEPEPVHVG